MNRKVVAAALASAAALVVGAIVLLTMLVPGPPSAPLAGSSSASCVLTPTVPASDGAGRVAAWAVRAGFRGPDVQIAVAVARAESDWNPKATNNNTNRSTDFGLMQINSIHASILAAGTWSDPQDNMIMAHKVFLGSGGRWTPWVTFNTGAYRKFMTDLPAAAAPPADCTPEAPKSVAGSCSMKHRAEFATFKNGQIPQSALCTVSFDTRHHLRADAANALVALNVAYRQQFGHNLCFTDSYRSLAAQISVKARKGFLAATPGTSNHGWGLAIDACLPGVKPWILGNADDVWMHKNAPKFGWVHPGWAEPSGSKPEPWHWGFKDGVHAP